MSITKNEAKITISFDCFVVKDTLTVQKAMEELYGPVLVFRSCPIR